MVSTKKPHKHVAVQHCFDNTLRSKRCDMGVSSSSAVIYSSHEWIEYPTGGKSRKMASTAALVSTRGRNPFLSATIGRPENSRIPRRYRPGASQVNLYSPRSSVGTDRAFRYTWRPS